MLNINKETHTPTHNIRSKMTDIRLDQIDFKKEYRKLFGMYYHRDNGQFPAMNGTKVSLWLDIPQSD